MHKKLVMIACALAAGAAWSLPAYSQAKPDVLVKQRQAAMVLQGKYFGPLNAMAQGKIPYDQKIVVRNAAYLDVLSRLAWDGFAPSTKGEKNGGVAGGVHRHGEVHPGAGQFPG